MQPKRTFGEPPPEATETPAPPPRGLPAPETPLIVWGMNGKLLHPLGTYCFFVMHTVDHLVVRESKYGARQWLRHSTYAFFEELTPELKAELDTLAAQVKAQKDAEDAERSELVRRAQQRGKPTPRD